VFARRGLRWALDGFLEVDELMPSFEQAWSHVSADRGGEAVSPELKPLLQDVYAEVMRRPPALLALKQALESLLTFLATPRSRTNANCWATDVFFCLGEGWEGDWAHLPDAFGDILGDLGGALHDSVRHPDIARNFESLPEQILSRVRRLEIHDTV